jgi:hypothetical protein
MKTGEREGREREREAAKGRGRGRGKVKRGYLPTRTFTVFVIKFVTASTSISTIKFKCISLVYL